MTNPYKPSLSADEKSIDCFSETRFPFFSVGPLTGVTVGISHAAGSETAWWMHGCPDFLIRSDPALVFVSIAIVAIGGLLFGLLYGLVVKTVCYRLRVNVRRDLHIWVANSTSFAVSFLVSDYELRARVIGNLPLYSLALTVLIAFVVAIATSRRDMATP